MVYLAVGTKSNKGTHALPGVKIEFLLRSKANQVHMTVKFTLLTEPLLYKLWE